MNTPAPLVEEVGEGRVKAVVAVAGRDVWSAPRGDMLQAVLVEGVAPHKAILVGWHLLVAAVSGQHRRGVLVVIGLVALPFLVLAQVGDARDVLLVATLRYRALLEDLAHAGLRILQKSFHSAGLSSSTFCYHGRSLA